MTLKCGCHPTEDMSKSLPAPTSLTIRQGARISASEEKAESRNSCTPSTVQGLRSAVQPRRFSKTISRPTEALRFLKYSRSTWAVQKLLQNSNRKKRSFGSFLSCAETSKKQRQDALRILAERVASTGKAPVVHQAAFKHGIGFRDIVD